MSPFDDTFYPIRRLHVIFALSAMALLAATAGMLAVDHRRPWRVYQRTFHDRIEPWMAEAALREQEAKEQNVGCVTGTATTDSTGAFHAPCANSTIAQHPGIGQELLRLPLIDALGRRDRIEQLYLPDLTINYNYRQVARFDRCTTCHQAMDKVLPGTWDEPAYRRRETLQVPLATPKQVPRPKEEAQPATAATLADVYGFSLADRGMLDPDAATVGLVLPETAAAHAGLCAGDVILKINGVLVSAVSDVRSRLLGEMEWGKPAALEIRRGLPHPYSASPARVVRRPRQPSSHEPVRVYDLPRRAGECYGLPVRVPHARRSRPTGAVA